jgi:hypothetical protein
VKKREANRNEPAAKDDPISSTRAEATMHEANSRFYDACVARDVQAVDACAAELREWVEECDDPPQSLDLDRRHDEGSTALHVAAANNQASMVLTLLRAGANPCALDDHARPPIYRSTDKSTRDAFRLYRADHEEQWDWSAARVPEPLTGDLLARRKQKEKGKRRRQKERRKDAAKAAAATAAAEAGEGAAKSAAATTASAAAVEAGDGARCDECGSFVGAASQFSRLSFKYCTSRCAQQHRRRLMAEAAEKRR